GPAGHAVRAKDELLGRTAAEPLDDLGLEVSAAVQVAVVIGREVRYAHRLTARLDRDLVEPVLGAGDDAGERVAGLVDRDDAPLLVAGAEPDALLAEQHAVTRYVEVRPVDAVGAGAHGRDRCLVHEVREVRAARARCEPAEPVEVDV